MLISGANGKSSSLRIFGKSSGLARSIRLPLESRCERKAKSPMATMKAINANGVVMLVTVLRILLSGMREPSNRLLPNLSQST